MKILYSNAHMRHSPRREFDGEAMTLGPHPETPARAEMILTALRRRGLGPPLAPRAPRRAELEGVHAPELLDFLEEFCSRGFGGASMDGAQGPLTGEGGGSGTAGAAEGAGFPERAADGAAGEAAADAFALPGWRSIRRPRSLRWRFGLHCFDPQTPLQPGTWTAALAAAGCALSGADLLLGSADTGPPEAGPPLTGGGETAVYALCRPPGHHAGRDFFGGYCYLNNAALAARRLAGRSGASGPVLGAGIGPSSSGRRRSGSRVAVLDLDFHHGNGTQEIFYRDPTVLYVSLHADPNEAYPYFAGYPEETGEGPGLGANRNFPLPQRCDERRYRETLAEALEVVRAFAPGYLVVSLGTDILSQDPVGGMGMSVQGFGRLGEEVRGLGLPTLVVQEGGYAVEAIGECVGAFLEPWVGSES